MLPTYGLVSSMGGGLSRALSQSMSGTGGTAAASGVKTAARYCAKPGGSAVGRGAVVAFANRGRSK